MDPLNKENICRFDKTVADTVSDLSTPPVRNPLQDVNQQVIHNRIVKKPQFCQAVTPTLVKTSGTQSGGGIKSLIPVYQDCVNGQTLNMEDGDSGVGNTEELQPTEELDLPEGEPSSSVSLPPSVDKCLPCKIEMTESCSNTGNAVVETGEHVCSDIHDISIQSAVNWSTVACSLIPNKVAKDSACSPLLLSKSEKSTMTEHAYFITPVVLDCGLQIQTEMVNTMSSPIIIPHMDKGVMVSTEMVDTATETEVISLCDTSIQSVVNQSTITCSPNRLATFVDSACSPLLLNKSEMATMTEYTHNVTPVKHDFGLQIQTDMVDTLSSPFVLPHKDQGVMVNPEMMDMATETEVVTFVDFGVCAVPECLSKHTMTESVGCDTQTSMTPVKLPNKQGKRLTAEEVRRLHPRALANQLDTMSVTNDRLQREVSCVEKERDKLKHQISEMKTVLKQRQKKIDEIQVIEIEKEQVKAECEKLKMELSGVKDDLMAVKEVHLNEVEELKAELFRRENSLELKSAHNLVLELQAELSEYSELADNLHQAEKLQSNIQQALAENFNKVSLAAERIQRSQAEIDQQQNEVLRQKKENEEEAERCAKEQKEVLDKYEDMKKVTDTTRMNMVQFENLYSNTSADLLTATRQVQLLSSELTGTKLALHDAELSKQGLFRHVEDLEENEKAGFLEIQGLTASLNVQENEINRLNKRLSEVEQITTEKIQNLQAEINRYELLTRNLQHTLESREQDIETMEKDLFECREYIEEQCEKYMDLQNKSKTSYAKLNAYEQENLQLSDHCSALRKECHELRKECHELRESLQTSQEELQATKMYASRLLLQQDAELKDSESSVKELTDKMNTLLTELQKKVGMETNTEEQNEVTGSKQNTDSQKDTKTPHKQSFLSLIMQAADKKNESTSPTDSTSSPDLHGENLSVDLCNTDNSGTDFANISGITKFNSETDSAEASPSTLSRQKLGHSGSSAFAPIRNGTNSLKIKSGPLVTDACNNNSSSNDVTLNDNINKEDSSEDIHNKVYLNDQILSLGGMFKEIVRLANIVEKASRSFISDLNDENEDLNLQITQTEMSEKHLKAELEIKQNEIEETGQQVKDLEERLRVMSENLSRFSDQESDISKYQSEVRNLRGQVDGLEAQKEIFNEQLREVLQNQQNSTSSGSTQNCQCQTEVLNLKMKLQKMREQSYKKDDYYEEIGRKASRRMRTLEENWKRAESEVYRFDELVEVIRQKLVKNTDLFKGNSDMKYVVRLIEGLESLPSKKDPLQPVKTVKW